MVGKQQRLLSLKFSEPTVLHKKKIKLDVVKKKGNFHRFTTSLEAKI